MPGVCVWGWVGATVSTRNFRNFLGLISVEGFGRPRVRTQYLNLARTSIAVLFSGVVGVRV